MTSAAAEVLLPIEREVCPSPRWTETLKYADILRIKPRWPIEAVAMRMTISISTGRVHRCQDLFSYAKMGTFELSYFWIWPDGASICETSENK
jgi:hypothetical protein